MSILKSWLTVGYQESLFNPMHTKRYRALRSVVPPKVRQGGRGGGSTPNAVFSLNVSQHTTLADIVWLFPGFY